MTYQFAEAQHRQCSASHLLALLFSEPFQLSDVMSCELSGHMILLLMAGDLG